MGKWLYYYAFLFLLWGVAIILFILAKNKISYFNKLKYKWLYVYYLILSLMQFIHFNRYIVFLFWILFLTPLLFYILKKIPRKLFTLMFLPFILAGYIVGYFTIIKGYENTYSLDLLRIFVILVSYIFFVLIYSPSLLIAEVFCFSLSCLLSVIIRTDLSSNKSRYLVLSSISLIFALLLLIYISSERLFHLRIGP
jgi:hypothetical protein